MMESVAVGTAFAPVLEPEKALWDNLHIVSHLDVFKAQFGSQAAEAECLAMAHLYWQNFRPQSRWVYAQGQRAGLIVILTVERFYFIVDFFITPEYRGKGIGSEVIHQIQTEAKDLGLFLLLEIFPTNLRAEAFYRRLGFLPAGERPPHHIQLLWSPGGWIANPENQITLPEAVNP